MVNVERIELLTRKYSGGVFSTEDQSRLDTLQARIQQLVPGTTDRDLEVCKDLERRLDEREKSLHRIRQKYGLGETG